MAAALDSEEDEPKSMTHALLWLTGIIAGISGGLVALFRKGGVYNPQEAPENPMSTDIAPPTINEPVAPNLALYAKAKSYLGEHLSLNDQISPEVGCAEAVSFILKNCGYPIPQGGIPSVSGLTSWMQENGFEESEFYGVGYVITGRNGAEAHIGICGENYIMSNTSPSAADPSKGLVGGKFQANFRLPGWLSVYPQTDFYVPPPVKNIV